MRLRMLDVGARRAMVGPFVTLMLFRTKCGRGKDFPDRKGIAQHMVFDVGMFTNPRRGRRYFALSKIGRSGSRM